MNTHYIRATIPADMHGTVIALLLIAADIVATEPEVTDAVYEAVRRTNASGQAHVNAERAAVHCAASRCALDELAAAAERPRHRWSTWQSVVREPWPILADVAGRYFGNDDAAAGIVPGRWMIETRA